MRITENPLRSQETGGLEPPERGELQERGRGCMEDWQEGVTHQPLMGWPYGAPKKGIETRCCSQYPGRSYLV